jgi:hypothetical protein
MKQIESLEMEKYGGLKNILLMQQNMIHRYMHKFKRERVKRKGLTKMPYEKLEVIKYDAKKGKKKAEELRRYQWAIEIKKIKNRVDKLEKHSHPPVDWENKIDSLERKVDELLYLFKESGIEERRNV